MYTDSNVSNSPNHFMVLNAIDKGLTDVGRIAKATKLQKSEVELIINDLSTQRLIVKTEKKGFFGNKKVEVKVTETGIRILNAKRKELEQKMQQMKQWYDNGNSTQLQNYMETNRMWIPMMLFSGIMNMIFFTSMMSFVGMGMSPLESAMMGNNADTGAGGGEVQSTDSASNSPTDGNSGADYSDAGFGGFDGGGFDGF